MNGACRSEAAEYMVWPTGTFSLATHAADWGGLT
jgi:hypothetical protein